MGSNMAENHPIAFRFVVEAQRRGATVIHVDPRFTRTSALADIYAPIRSGTDIAFLGGIIRYILENDLWFREWALAYTNIAHIIEERLRRHRGQRRRVLRLRRRTPGPTRRRPGSTRARPCPPRSPNTACNRRRGRPATTRAMAEEPAAAGPTRCSIRAASTRSCGGTIARYTPEMVETRHRLPARHLPEGRRRARPELGPRAHRRVLLRGRLDPSLDGRADHPGRHHHPGPARQCRAAGRRHHGAARPRVDPGLDRHPDALQHAADLPAAAERLPQPRHARKDYLKVETPPTGWWANFPKYVVSLLKAWYGAGCDGGRTSGATGSCRS